MTETSDQRATRRRWINLAELVAVAGVLIAAASLYLSYADRRDAAADKAAASATEAKARGRLELTGTVERKGNALRLSDPKQDLNDVVITFPKALGIDPERPGGDAVIDAGSFAKTMLKLTDNGADDRAGRLPVLITASYVDGDVTRTASGVYDVLWQTHGGGVFGRSFKLTGLRLRQRGGSPAAIDAAWTREKP